MKEESNFIKNIRDREFKNNQKEIKNINFFFFLLLNFIIKISKFCIV